MNIKPLVIPKNLGDCADLLMEINAEALAVSKLEKLVTEKRRKLTDHIINKLPKSNLEGVQGKIARVVVETVDKPTAKNWPLIWGFIVKKKAWDLLQKRLSSGAVESRWGQGEKIPGVEKFKATVLRIHKVKPKKGKK